MKKLTLGFVVLATLALGSVVGCAAETAPDAEEASASTQQALSGIGSTPVAGQWIQDPSAAPGEIDWINIGARYQGSFGGTLEGGTATALINQATGTWTLSLRSGVSRRGFSVVSATATTLVLASATGTSSLVRK
jgi:hypothetical protein